VSLGDLLGPEFKRSPSEMFSIDGFHPSAAGYAAAAACGAAQHLRRARLLAGRRH
jgi:hypothetical protein